MNISKLKMNFDEDIFQDTLIKCSETYKDDVSDIKKIKAYFWTAFKTNTINCNQRRKRVEDIDATPVDIIDEEYMEEIDEFVEIAKDALYGEFGEEITDLWLRHVTKDEEYEDLARESGINNIHYQFKKIRKYIREELPKKNQRFKEIMGILR
jgi:DNA-directed RNA polymerase specialized sigma24 family protein